MSNPEKIEQEEKVSEEMREWLTDTFGTTLEQFHLTVDELKDKKIIEIGAFDRRLAATCLLLGGTKEVYSVEPALGSEDQEGYADKQLLMAVLEKLPSSMRQQIEQRTLITDAEHIPLQDESVDVILGRSVPWQSVEQLAGRLKEGLRLGHEIRLYPITDRNQHEVDEALKLLQQENLQTQFEYVVTTDTEIPTENGMVRVQDKVLIVRDT